jgi:hypothetical protein
MADRIICDICGQMIPPHGHYIVRMDIFADPAMPAMSAEEIAETDFQSQLAELLEEMKHLSAEDLQDQVHRRFEFRVCRFCQMRFLANPLGLPRQTRSNRN